MDLYGRNQRRNGSQSEWSATSSETGPEVIENPTRLVLDGAVVGDRFHPTDQELVDYYLQRFILGVGYEGNELPIAEVKFYKFEPFQLPGLSKVVSNDREWYFISRLEFMDKKRKRFTRKTKTGTWKPTGKPRKVLAKRTRKEIGSKRTLVFYEKKVKTDWVMHEYQRTPDSKLPNAGKFVIIKLKRKHNEKSKKNEVNYGPTVECDDEDRYDSMMAANSACHDDEFVSSDLGCHNHDQMTAISTYDLYEPSCGMVSSCDIQSSDTELKEGRRSTPTTPLYLEDQSTIEKGTHESLFLLEDQSANPKNIHTTSDIQSSLKVLDEGGHSNPMTPLVFEDESFNGNCEFDGLTGCDLDFQILAFDVQGGGWAPSASIAMPSSIGKEATFNKVVPSQLIPNIPEFQSLNKVAENSPIEVSDFEAESDQRASAYEVMAIASCCGHHVVPSDFEYQNIVEITAMSTYDSGEPSSRATSSYQNQSSISEIREDGYFPMRVSSLILENKEENEQSNRSLASDSENQMLPSEVEDSPPKEAPSAGNQVTRHKINPGCSVTSKFEDACQNMEIDKSFLHDYDFWSSLMDSDVDAANETFREVDPEVLAEWEAFRELQCSLNPAVQQTGCAEQCM